MVYAREMEKLEMEKILDQNMKNLENYSTTAQNIIKNSGLVKVWIAKNKK